MAAFIIMPKLGMTMETGVLTKWLKKEGDKVEKGEPLFELETDKLNTVVEATESGVLRKILVPEGTEVAILKEVGVIGGAGGGHFRSGRRSVRSGRKGRGGTRSRKDGCARACEPTQR